MVQGMEMSQFMFGDGRTGGLEHVDLSTNHKVSKVRNTLRCSLLVYNLSCIQPNHHHPMYMCNRLKQLVSLNCQESTQLLHRWKWNWTSLMRLKKREQRVPL